jgi:cytoskeleton protein RodZ
MSEEPTNTAAGAGRDEPLAGRRLAAARRARNISLQDVANELHLDAPKVTALEQNRFEALGGAVFVKGYLRKYAEVVGLSADAVLADYRHFETGDDAPPVVGRRRPPPREFPAGALLTALVVLAVLAGALWVWRSGALEGLWRGGGAVEPARSAVPPPGTETPPAASPGLAAGEASATAADDAGEPEASGVAASSNAAPLDAADGAVGTAAEGNAEEPPEPVLAAPRSVPPPEGQVSLQVTFTGDCWTEVSDAAGDRLYFGLGRAGETVSVTGKAPLHVLLGQSANASLTVDGQAYAVPARARRGDTARLTIAGAAGGDAP